MSVDIYGELVPAATLEIGGDITPGSMASLQQIFQDILASVGGVQVAAFTIGRSLSKAEDIIVHETGDRGLYLEFARQCGFGDRKRRSVCTRVFELFEPYEQLLPRISLKVQEYFGEHKDSGQLFSWTIEKARTGSVSYAEFQAKLLPGRKEQEAAELAAEADDSEFTPQKKNAPLMTGATLQDGEDDGTLLPAPRPPRKRPAPSLNSIKLAQRKKEFFEDSARFFKAFSEKLDSFFELYGMPHPKGQTWYIELETGWELVLRGLREWQQ